MSGGEKVGWPTRRALLGATAVAGLAPAHGLAQQRPPAERRPPPEPQTPPPVVFVHGNGDSSALWINNIWRFETNGWRRNHLFAIDFTYPNARRDDSKEQKSRSSTEDQMKELMAIAGKATECEARIKGAAGGDAPAGEAAPQ